MPTLAVLGGKLGFGATGSESVNAMLAAPADSKAFAAPATAALL